MTGKLSNVGKRVIALIVAILLIILVHWWFTHPFAKTGTTVIETDSTIITSTVIQSKDTAGNMQFKTIRKVENK